MWKQLSNIFEIVSLRYFSSLFHHPYYSLNIHAIKITPTIMAGIVKKNPEVYSLLTDMKIVPNIPKIFNNTPIVPKRVEFFFMVNQRKIVI